MAMLSASFLPEEILFEILSKLPAKSVVRFKCVSKFFSSLLVDHPFADLHRNWSLTLPSRMSILISFPLTHDPITNYRYYTINYSEENQGKLQANRLQYIDDDHRILSGELYLSSSVNGLICFCTYSRCRDDIAIHNLSTRHHISLPSTCPPLPRDSPFIMNTVGLLGFDSVSRRFKVLKSVHLTDRGYKHFWVKHWVFTLGVDKSWREIHSSSSYHPYKCFHRFSYFHTSVYIDGVIYSATLNYLSGHKIVAFHVRAENFQLIPPPPPATMQVGGLVEVEGRLAILDVIRDNMAYGMAIWILEESMVWKKQNLILIPLPFEELKHFIKRNMFFATSHVGEITMLVRKSASILFYNFRRKSWRKFDIGKLPPLRAVPTTMHFILDNVF